jgi:hypothetical protein
MARPGKYIDGIYNYCDRWCERCPFTQRCRSFAMEKAMERHMARRDKQNAEFWAAMQRTLGDALNDVAKQVESLAPEPEPKPKSKRRSSKSDPFDDPAERPVRRHPLAKLTMQYSDAADEWFDAHKQLAKLFDKHPQENPLADAASVIRWYQLFIHVKLCRALSGVLRVHEEDRDDLVDEYGNPYPKDSDGSAKIAIIAMERSIGAWSFMREHYPNEKEPILKLMAMLYRARTLADQTFPDARAFHRPGFDDASGD